MTAPGGKPQLVATFVDVASARAGQPFTASVDFDQDPDEIQDELYERFEASPFGLTAGWTLVEATGVGDIEVPKTVEIEDLSALGLGIRRHGAVFIAALKMVGTGTVAHAAEALALFDERYIGAFGSKAEWGKEFAARMDLACDETIEPYVDWAGFADGAEDADQFETIVDDDGRVHVFGPATGHPDR